MKDQNKEGLTRKCDGAFRSVVLSMIISHEIIKLKRKQPFKPFKSPSSTSSFLLLIVQVFGFSIYSSLDFSWLLLWAEKCWQCNVYYWWYCLTRIWCYKTGFQARLDNKFQADLFSMQIFFIEKWENGLFFCSYHRL